MVQIAFQQGAKTELDCLAIITRRLTFTGSALRPRTVDEKAAIARALLENVWPLLEARKVRPIIYATFSLADVQKAHELMETSTHIGKIMLKVKGEWMIQVDCSGKDNKILANSSGEIPPTPFTKGGILCTDKL